MHDIEKLKKAEKLLEEVRDTLNQARHRCGCCGLTVYDNEAEWVARQMLNAALQRVGKVAKSLAMAVPANDPAGQEE